MPRAHGSGAAEQRIPPTRTPVGRVPAAAGALATVWVGLLALNRASRRVTGDSMRPTLAPGDVVLVLPLRSGRLRRGDVIVIRDPRDPARETVKRIVGLSGDHIAMRGDTLEIAGVPYDEPYAHRGPEPGRGSWSVSWRVPPRHVVVLGDDRGWSTDSRVYGPVSHSLVVGRVAARLRPPGRAPHVAPHPLR